MMTAYGNGLRILTVGGFLLLLLSAQHARAADAIPKKYLDRIVPRYQNNLTASGTLSPAAEERIQQDRVLLRSDMESDLRAILNADSSLPVEATTKYIDRQRQIVQQLNEQIDNTNVSLSLLKEQMQSFIDPVKSTGSTLIDRTQLADALGRQTILEVQLAVLKETQVIESDRLAKLSTEEKRRNMSQLIGILTFLGIIVGIFWLERMIRHYILDRINQPRLRFGITKLFSFVIYVTLAFWIIQSTVAEHPEVLTVIAVIGAALTIVMQDLIKNLVGWLHLRSFASLGQRITIGNFTGDIVDIGMLSTTLFIADMEGNALTKGAYTKVPNQHTLNEPIFFHPPSLPYEVRSCIFLLSDITQTEEAMKLIETILASSWSHFAKKANAGAFYAFRGILQHEEHFPCDCRLEPTSEGKLTIKIVFTVPRAQAAQAISQLTQQIVSEMRKRDMHIFAQK